MRRNEFRDEGKERCTVPVSKINHRVMFRKMKRNGASMSDVLKERNGMVQVYWSTMECRDVFPHWLLPTFLW